MSWADWGTRNEVDASNVVDQYQYGSITLLTVGTNTALAESNDPPVGTGAWSRWLGYRRPALSATQAGVDVPGLGQGTAALAATIEIPCDPTPRRLTVACGQQKTHRVEGVVDENGAPIDTGDSTLEYVVEDGTGRDFGTGSATMVDPGIFEFATSDANRVPGSYRWAIRTEPPQSAVVVFGELGDYVVLDIAKPGDPASLPAVCSHTGVQTIVVNDDNGIPISCACVSVTTDAAGTDLIASGKADSLGNVHFDAAITATKIYVWRSKKGYRLINPICVEIQNSQGEE